MGRSGAYLFRGAIETAGYAASVCYLALDDPRVTQAAHLSDLTFGNVDKLTSGDFVVNVASGPRRGVAFYSAADGSLGGRICTPYNVAAVTVLPDGNLALLRLHPAAIFTIAPTGLADSTSACGAIESRVAQVNLTLSPHTPGSLQFVQDLPGLPGPSLLIGDSIYDLAGTLRRVIAVAGEPLDQLASSWLTGGPFGGNYAFIHSDGSEITIVSPQ